MVMCSYTHCPLGGTIVLATPKIRQQEEAEVRKLPPVTAVAPRKKGQI